MRPGETIHANSKWFYALADRGVCAAPASAQTPAAITVTSPTLKANEMIPKDHTADGKNVSPALMWSGAPAATKQFALVMDDPDVPIGGQAASCTGWSTRFRRAAKGLPAELPMDATLTTPADTRRHDPGPVGLPPRRLSRSGAASRKAASLHLDRLCARRRAAARRGPQSQPVDGGDEGTHHRPGIARRDLRARQAVSRVGSISDAQLI